MKLIVKGNVIACPHPPGLGTVAPGQKLVRVAGHAVVVAPNPIGAPIAGCPNAAIPNIPCATTLTAEPVSYSKLVRIDGVAVVVDRATGVTSGSPPGMPKYTVSSPGQDLVEVSS